MSLNALFSHWSFGVRNLITTCGHSDMAGGGLAVARVRPSGFSAIYQLLPQGSRPRDFVFASKWYYFSLAESLLRRLCHNILFLLQICDRFCWHFLYIFIFMSCSGFTVFTVIAVQPDLSSYYTCKLFSSLLRYI